MKTDTVLNAKAYEGPRKWILYALPTLGEEGTMYIGFRSARGQGLYKI